MLGASNRAAPARGNRLKPVSLVEAPLLARPSTVREPTTSPLLLSTTRMSMAT